MSKIKIFDHYNAGEKLYIQMVAPIADKYDLTYMEFTVLMFLANHPQYDTAAEVVKNRHLTKSHVSISVKGLLSKEILIEFFENNNNKTKHLKISEKAEPIVNEGRAVQQRFTKLLTEGFSEEEKKQWVEAIKRIDENINKNLNK